MSVYLISGKDGYRIRECLQSLLRQNGIEKENTVIIDASSAKNFDLEGALMQCYGNSLFDDGQAKAVILQNPFFLSASQRETKPKKTAARKKKDQPDEKDRRYDILEQYLRSPGSNTHLFFYCADFEADSRRKEYKLLAAHNAQILKMDKMKSWEFANYADRKLNEHGISMNRDAKEELMRRVNGDTSLFHKALEKILLYGSKSLTREDVRGLVSLNPEVNVFYMSNAFVKHDLAGVLQAKEDMLRAGYDITAMVAMLGTRLRAFYLTKQLYEEGLSPSQITTRLHANEYAIKMNIENTAGLRASDLLRYLNELAEVDQNIKAGISGGADSFDTFLLRSTQGYAGNQRAL